MPKAETTFRPIGDSEKKMHGNTAILISGFSADEQSSLSEHFPEWAMENVSLVVVATDTLSLTLAEATALPNKTNMGRTADLPRAVVMSGLQERQLNAFMRGYREAGFTRPMWASVTPHSEQWTVKYLLVELVKERKAMREAMEAERARKEGTEPSTTP